MPGHTPLPAISIDLPLLPLRDVVVFPHMVIPLFVGRPKSIKALEMAMVAERRIMLVAQKTAAKDEPSVSDMFDVGCVSTILQMLKLPDGTVKVLVEGQQRAQVACIGDAETHFVATVTPVEATPDASKPSEIEALRRAVMQQFDQYVKLNKKIPPEILTSISSIDDPGRLADTIAAHLPLKLENKQAVLDLSDVKARLENLFGQLDREVDILNVDKKIRGRVKRQMEKNQRDFYLNEQVKAIQKELGEGDEGADIEEIEKKIKLAKMPTEARKKAENELKKLKLMSPMSAEATVVRNYIDVLSNLPWSKKTKIKHDLVNAEGVLNEDHFGLDKVKDRILEHLAVQQRVDKVKAPILCLVGPPGVGKTSLGQSIARATGRKYVRMALGGMRDEAEIRGHRRTYIGALPGKVLQSLTKVGARNPLFLLDEIDKLGTDFRGDPSSALLEVLDPEQNHTFSDHYVEVDFDLSDVMFVATSNSMNIQPALLDRMEVIRLSGYTEDEKVSIAMKYLLPKQLKNNGVKDEELNITEPCVRDMVRYYTREAGVRSLERELSKICRKVVKGLQLKQFEPQVVVTEDKLPEFLGVRKYSYGRAELQNQIGQVVGLAWTEVGGDLLTIEAATMPGKGVITRTGSLGDVMKESVEAARTVVRSRARMLGIKDEAFEKRDIHIHVPDGATPKDGPSAGVAMITAFVSALTGIPVRGNVAMTGEITLRGEVTAIGGLKEKLLAALRGGIRTVLIPEENVKDLQEIPDNVKSGLEIVPVRWIDKALEVALASKPVPLIDEEVAVVVAAAAADKPVSASVAADGLKH
ncbi:endopeptidase La [Verminephrobacter aporrectodeae subsp. tuberculatae]|uniref:Lon protease n=1 Tax=Verminephrobacter aporrectodeae subsp. tuberculatae TaxID=1110392 RepID=A0ABT3KT16_9BURK|nr:endopeptidase La [Verminephrobacter aporrectodeae]MCW5220102.1 endopeptidase La [Verminephrobacter aporrectodeae subsp. tuberculatae]MCW5255933.1 endopeptidase La [Verminephrobacter aporrectodeae subsp. tuberculatae]MCW5289390.1 endopeptidase La [Verminephrobacter aporrectodeae subsp. tuberculatae]MCW5320945.1 endopeptidase La [Verminephrobacter aporrectodeae subsp. tuberculatae]MCW8166950.1 endopeptidase La [Verminephrobacter aporrectodeae subsp. tuberculatae]